MGQARQRGIYEERKTQSIERKEAERIEREKLKVIREQERAERISANSDTSIIKCRSSMLHTAAMLAVMGVIVPIYR